MTGVQIAAVFLIMTAVAGLLQFGTLLAPALTSAVIGAVVSWSIFKAGRNQGKRATTLELYKEYYTQSFADDRVKAERFFRKHRRNEWTNVNPYDLDDPEGWRSGYSSVTRYFHRVAILYQQNEIQRDLAHELLSRELGYWFAMSFLPRRDRNDWWTKDAIYDLGARFWEGKRRDLFRLGYLDACRARKKPNKVVQDGSLKKLVSRLISSPS